MIQIIVLFLNLKPSLEEVLTTTNIKPIATNLLLMDYIQKAIHIRAFEQNLLDSYSKGYLNGTVHTCIGQELLPVILSEKIKNLRKFVVSNHRGHGHYLGLYPDKSKELLQEIMGLPNGVSGGYGGSQHLIGDEFMSNGIQGGMIPTLAGATEAQMNASDTPFIGIGYIGDGTLGQGVLYESLNFIGIRKLPILIVLDDNNYAQSTNTAKWTDGLLESRFQGFGLRFAEINMREFSGDFNKINESISDIVEEVLNGQPTVLRVLSNRLKPHSKGDDNRSDEYIHSIINSDYLTKVLQSDHDLQNYYNNLLINLAQFTSTLHNNESNDFVLQNRINDSVMFKQQKHYSGSYNTQINIALKSLLQDNEDLILIGEDIRDTSNDGEKIYGGAFKVTKGLSTEFNERIINTPISEQLIVGFALGYSLKSSGSIAEIMFGDFLTLTLDQLLQHAAKFKTMFGTNINIPLIIRTPMGGKRGYGPTHSQSLEKHFLGIDGLNVFALNHRICPNSFYKEILATKSPTLVIENKILYTLKHKPLPEFYDFSDWNKDYFVLQSNEFDSVATLFCYGESLNVAEGIADALLDDELSIQIICCSNLNTKFSMLDWTLFEEKNIITIEEGSDYASWSSIITNQILTNRIKIASFRSFGNNRTIPSNLNAELNILSHNDEVINYINTLNV